MDRVGRRVWLVLILMLGVAAPFVNAPPAAAAGSCTDSWVGGDGNWFVASNWSSGAIPGPNDAVCITAPGSYTVTVPGGPAGPAAGQAAADTLQLGGTSGTQKLVIQADNSCGDGTGAGSLELLNHSSAVTAASIGANGQVELTQNANTCSGVANGTALKIDNGGALVNGGQLTSDVGSATGSAVTGRTIQGSLENAGGTIAIDADTTWSGKTFDNAGTINFSTSVLTVPAATGATFINDAGGSINNSEANGYVLVDQGNTFEQGAGTANDSIVRPGADPLVLIDGGTLRYTGNESSNIEVEGQSTLDGDVPSQALLAIDCSGSEPAVLHASSFTNAGFIGLYGAQQEPCTGARTLSVDSSAGPGTGTLTNTGQIEGYGTIAGSLDNTTGTAIPGDTFVECTPCTGAYTPGAITVTGNYAQGPGGTLGVINMFCPTCGGGPGYSQLSVQGSATLAGTLQMWTGGVNSAYSEAMQVLGASSVSGRFSNVEGQLDPTRYDASYAPEHSPTTVTVQVVMFPTLAVTRAGSGSGQVASAPAGINCGAGNHTCSAGFPNGQAVSLAAIPAAGSKFTGWSGAGCRGTGRCTVTIDSDQHLTARFVRIPLPRCRLRLQRRTVTGRGSLKAIISCNRAARLNLQGIVVEWRGARTKRFALGPAYRRTRRAGTVTLRLKLPPAALGALRRHHRETIALALRATNPGGTTFVTTRRHGLRATASS
jgi:hypothetical protein